MELSSRRPARGDIPAGIPPIPAVESSPIADINNEALISPFPFGQGGKGMGNSAISEGRNYPAIK